MKRFFRFASGVATVLSLFFFIIAAIIWIRGYLISDSVYRSVWYVEKGSVCESAYWLFSARGEIGIGRRVQQSRATSDFVEENKHLFDRPEYSWKIKMPPVSLLDESSNSGLFHQLGFQSLNDPMPPQMATGGYRQWLAPVWFVCLLTGVLPAWRLRGWFRKRYPFGHCPKCGYDLRATPGRCPECGHRATPPVA